MLHFAGATDKRNNDNVAIIPGCKTVICCNVKKNILHGQELFFNYNLNFVCECEVRTIMRYVATESGQNTHCNIKGEN